MAGDDSSHRRYQVSGRVALSVLRSDGDVGKTCFFSARLLTPCSPALEGFGCNLACNHGASATGLGDGSHSEKSVLLRTLVRTSTAHFGLNTNKLKGCSVVRSAH
jgi:hypothetical protein